MMDSQFVSINGLGQFVLNSNPFYFAGANCYDLFTFGSGQGDTDTSYMNKTKIDAHLETMANNGVTVLRTWAFNSNSESTWHVFESDVEVYNEQQFEEFDYIVASAKRNNMHLIVTLENYWADYGGIPQRLQWAGVPPSEQQPNQGSFFASEAATSSYLAYVTHFLRRTNKYTGTAYVDEPTIMAWEVMNEPRYEGWGDDVSSTVLRGWMDTVGKVIKGIDGNHLLGSGLEGHGTRYNFGGDEGNDFRTIHASPYIDFCSAHPYPTEEWAQKSVSETLETLRQWTADCQGELKKPMVVGEFNVHSGGEPSRVQWWEAMFQAIEELDVAGDCFWWFQDKTDLNPSQLDTTFGVVEGDPELQVFATHSANMRRKSYRESAVPHGVNN